MPPTAGVLRFAQYLKNRNPTVTSVTSTVPPASQRKRVAAVRDKKNTPVRLPLSPPRPNTKGTAGFIAPYIPTTCLYHGIVSYRLTFCLGLQVGWKLVHSTHFLCIQLWCEYMYRCSCSSSSTCWEGWAMCRNKRISST